MKENVLVIGGAGFLGSHLADELTESGYNVTIFDYKPSPWQQKNQKMIIGNILDEDSLEEALAGQDYVYHMAGIADIGEAALQPKNTIRTNILGTNNVIEACLAGNIRRLLFASTVYVYSQQGSFYRVTKQAAELILENYHEAFGLNYTILRYGSLYGPRSQSWNGINKYISQAVRDKKIIYNGTGEERREYIHVRDAAKLSIQALKKAYENKSLTLTGTQSFSSRELMLMIQEIMGQKVNIIFDNDRKDPNHYDLTPYRFSPKVAWKIVPTDFYDLGQGILDLVEEIYRKNNNG